MNVFITETQETKEIGDLLENGCSWLCDFLGNNDAEIKWNNEEDRYECDTDYEFGWWESAIEKQNSIKSLESELTQEQKDTYFYEIFDLSLEDEQNARIKFLIEILEK